MTLAGFLLVNNDILQVFDNAGIPQNNMKIIANVLQFDGNGTATNFNSPLITTGNKATACQKVICTPVCCTQIGMGKINVICLSVHRGVTERVLDTVE